MKKIKGWITTAALIVLFASQASIAQAGIIFGGLSQTDVAACTDSKSTDTLPGYEDDSLGGIIFGGLIGIIFGGNITDDGCTVSGGQK